MEQYLKQIVEKARKILGKDYNRVTEHLKPFELINTYLIHQANEQEWNILIKTPHEHEREQFYVPTIFAIALWSLFKNYVDYEPGFEVGDVLDKDGVRYEVIEKLDGQYVLYSKIQGGLKKYVPQKLIKTYVHTTGDLKGRKTTQLESYKKFFASTFNIHDVVVSKFKYKYVIVAGKEIFESLKEYEFDGKKIYKAFPFQYITKKGKRTENLPIDPMIYIVPDYETAQDWVFNQEGDKIDTVIFIGASKYQETAGGALNDKQKGLFQNCIFIGSKDISEFTSIRKWRWTQEEINYFNQTSQAEIEPIVVDFPELSKKIVEFDELICNIEDEYAIDLSQYRRYIKKILNLIVPDREDSRLNNQLKNLIGRFEQDETLQDNLFECGVTSTDEQGLLKIVFDDIITLIKINNPKYQKMKQLEEYNFVVVAKPLQEVWEEELKNMGFRRTQVITHNEFLKLDRSTNALFLDYFDYKRIKSILECHHHVSILLYPEEKKFLNWILNRYERELQREYNSSDRQELSGVKYTEEVKKEESVSELIQRLYKEEETVSTESVDRENEDVLRYEITFEHGESVEIDSNRSVLRKDGDRFVSTKAEFLKHGDVIRIYDNVHRDKLYRIAKQEDTNGVFEQIEKDARIWKEALIQYYSKLGKDIKKLHEKLKAKGLERAEATLYKWIDMEDKDKFPIRNRDLYLIKKTVDNDILNQNFESIKRSKQKYRGIMIALGRDMSEEITEYIQTKKKGNILSRFSDDQIKAFIAENAPLRTIKTIEIKGEDSDENE